MIEPGNQILSISRQCELLGLPRSSYYYKPIPESAENLLLMRLMDEAWLKTPFYGARRMAAHLKVLGYTVNIKRIRRLMQLMGIEAVGPKPNLSRAEANAQKYPYLLRGLNITHPNQVWCTDITYIPMSKGFMYLVAIMDWYSRYVLSWELSNSLELGFCLSALQEAFGSHGKPQIFNTD
jgi:putative transposase